MQLSVRSPAQRSRRSCLVGIGVLLLLLLPSAAQAQAAFITDHFKCYIVQGALGDQQIGLLDQFDQGIIDTTMLIRRPVRFCTPVEKQRLDLVPPVITPIHFKQNHLLFYRLASSALEPTRKLKVSNQFGTHTLYTFQVAALAVPARKNQEDPPDQLDHFKCYAAYGWSPNKLVSLKDQFLPNGVETRVIQAFLFCNPVQKLHGTVVTPIRHPNEHLVCYYTKPTGFPAGTIPPSPLVQDQFRQQILQVGRSDMLCVPSLKVKWSLINP